MREGKAEIEEPALPERMMDYLRDGMGAPWYRSPDGMVRPIREDGNLAWLGSPLSMTGAGLPLRLTGDQVDTPRLLIYDFAREALGARFRIPDIPGLIFEHIRRGDHVLYATYSSSSLTVAECSCGERAQGRSPHEAIQLLGAHVSPASDLCSGCLIRQPNGESAPVMLQLSTGVVSSRLCEMCLTSLPSCAQCEVRLHGSASMYNVRGADNLRLRVCGDCHADADFCDECSSWHTVDHPICLPPEPGVSPCSYCDETSSTEAMAALTPSWRSRNDDRLICIGCVTQRTVRCVGCGLLDTAYYCRNLIGGEFACSGCISDPDARIEYCGHCASSFRHDAESSLGHDCPSFNADDGECMCASCAHTRDELIHSYDYRPRLRFHGEGKVFLGMEIELSCPYPDNVATLAKDMLGNLIYIKEDSSIGGGVEIVTHPMTYQWAIENFNFKDFKKLRDEGARSTKACGIHVHVSKKSFDSPAHEYRWILLFFRNPEKMKRFAGRESREYADFKRDERELALKVVQKKQKGRSRYSAINTRGDETYEVRIFASTTNGSRLKAILAFIDASVEYTRSLSSRKISQEKGWDYDLFIQWMRGKPKYSPAVSWNDSIADLSTWEIFRQDLDDDDLGEQDDDNDDDDYYPDSCQCGCDR